MKTAVIYDCENLTNRTSPSRFWCGPWDPDPTIVQIGAVRLGLDGDAPLLDTFDVIVRPKGRDGTPVELDPFFTELTGITPARVADEGVPLADALARFDAFADGDRMWSWGKDELNMIAVSCWIEGIVPPMRPDRFGNAAALVLAAGVPQEVVDRTRSNTLAATVGAATPPLRPHDGVDDARSVAYALAHLMRTRALDPSQLT